MKEKQFDPARLNTESPSPGLAAVNTHNPDEEPGVQEQQRTVHEREEGKEKHADVQTVKKEEEKND